MAAYKVATTLQGSRVWWPHWQLPNGIPGYTSIRDATDEESALMEKIVWDKDTPADLEKLKALIQQS
jgi:hypothetical protein